MKKLLSLALALLMSLSLVACGGNSSSSGNSNGDDSGSLPTINFWTTGSQNVADVFTEVIAAYNAKEDRLCNVEMQFILTGTGDSSLGSRYAAAYITGKDTSFDIMAGNGSDFETYTAEAGSDDAFIDLDFSKMSNWDNVQMSASFYQEKLVPYRGTTVVLSYDSAKLPNPPQTWDELTAWIKANPGAFTYNTPDSGGAGKAFVLNALWRLIDDPDAFANASDSKYLDMLDAGFNWLTEIHPYLYTSGGHIQYPVKNQGALDLLASGEVMMVPAWADGTLDGLEKGTLPETVKMYQLSDLSLTGTDCDMAICATSQHVDECYDFMNYVISSEAQQIFVEVMKAVPVVDASTLEQTESVAAVSDLNPSSFNVLSVGSNETSIGERWYADIATLS